MCFSKRKENWLQRNGFRWSLRISGSIKIQFKSFYIKDERKIIHCCMAFHIASLFYLHVSIFTIIFRSYNVSFLIFFFLICFILPFFTESFTIKNIYAIRIHIYECLFIQRFSTGYPFNWTLLANRQKSESK